MTFSERVKSIVSRIPKGETLTYKQVAALAGSPNASRAVGNIMRSNYDPNIPCHRVIRSDGNIGSYNRGGSQQKSKLLQQEKAIR